MDSHSFFRVMDSRPPFILQNGLNGLNGLNGFNGLAGVNGLTGLSLMDLPTENRGKTRVAREEAALETKIVQMINGGEWEALNPNSGKAVAVGEHHICVAYHEDSESGYRTWEWHGHLMLFDEEEGYTPEYIYGNHFQPMEKKDDTEDAGVVNGVGLGGIIEGDDKKKQGPILHRNVNKDSSASLSNGGPE